MSTTFGFFFSVIRGVISLIENAVGVVMSAVTAAFGFLSFAIGNLHWIVFIIALWGLGSYWSALGTETAVAIEFSWRCRIFPIYELFEPFINALADAYTNVICWWNAIGLFNRLFTQRLIIEIWRSCPNDGDIIEFVRKVATTVVLLAKKFFTWLASPLLSGAGPDLSGPFLSVLPVEPVLESLRDVVIEIQELLTCLCDDLRPLFMAVERILISDNLKCGLHQLANAALHLAQIVIGWLFELIIFIFELIFSGGNLELLLDAIRGQGSLSLPRINLPAERLAMAAHYAGEWLNDIIQIIICTFKSELDGQSDSFAVIPLYDTCMADPALRLNIFCIVGPLIGTVARFVVVVWDLIAHLGQILEELFTLPPGPRYLLDEWEPNVVWDTIREPPARFNHSVVLNNPPIIPLSNVSAISYPKGIEHVYGNMTFPPAFSCALENTSNIELVCIECPHIQNRSIEVCLCILANEIDDLLEPVLGNSLTGNGRIVSPLLCCFIPALGRVVVWALKTIIDLLRHLLVIDKLGFFFADQNNLEILATELAGRPYVFGGLIRCFGELFVAIDNRLGCVSIWIFYPIKAVLEIARIIIVAVARLFNDISQTGEPGIPDWLCIQDNTTCVQLEGHIFQWFRKTRLKTPLTFNYTYLEIDPGITDDRWIDCIGELISLEFIFQFIPGIPDLPNIFCGVHFGFRIVVEGIKLIVEVVLVIIDSLTTLIRGSNRLLVIEYFACEDVDLCSNIAEIISDVEDFLECPCVILRGIDSLIGGSDEDDIPCLCDIFNALGLFIAHILRSIATLASSILKLLNCLVVENFQAGDPPDCKGDLGVRFQDTFDHTINAIKQIEELIGGVGCLIGSIFDVECVGTPNYPRRVDFTIDEEPISVEDAENIPLRLTCERHGAGLPIDECLPRDRFQDLFKTAASIATALIKFILDFIGDILSLAFSGAGLTSISISQVVGDLLRGIGAPVWGALAADNDEFFDTLGTMQYIGLLVNCLLGPNGGACLGEATPAGSCIGDLFFIIGSQFRSLWGLTVSVVEGVVALGECIISGCPDGKDFGQVIVGVFTDLFAIVKKIIFKVIPALLDAVIEGLAGIVDVILPPLATVVRVVGKIVKSALNAILGLLKFFFGGKKRFMEDIVEHFQNASSVDDFRTTFPNIDPVTLANLADPAKMLQDMTPDTLCRRVMASLINKRSFAEMDWWEELGWKGCYSLYAFPHLYNAQEEPVIYLPPDYSYNIMTFLHETKAAVETLQLYMNYRQGHSILGDTFVDIVNTAQVHSILEQAQDAQLGPARKRTHVIGHLETNLDRIVRAEQVYNQTVVPHMDGYSPIVYENDVPFKIVARARGLNSRFAESLIDAFEHADKESYDAAIMRFSAVYEHRVPNRLRVPTIVPTIRGVDVESAKRRVQTPAADGQSPLEGALHTFFQPGVWVDFVQEMSKRKARDREVTRQKRDEAFYRIEARYRELGRELPAVYESKRPRPRNPDQNPGPESPEGLHRYMRIEQQLPRKLAKIAEHQRSLAHYFDTFASWKGLRDVWMTTRDKRPLPPRASADDTRTRKKHSAEDPIRYDHRSLQERYGHVLKGQTLLGHRLSLLGQALGAWINQTSTRFGSQLAARAHAHYIAPLHQKHNDALRNGKIPVATRIYSVYQRLRNTSPLLSSMLPEVSENAHRKLVYPFGDPAQSPDFVHEARFNRQFSADSTTNLPLHGHRRPDDDDNNNNNHIPIGAAALTVRLDELSILCPVAEVVTCPQCAQCMMGTTNCTGCATCTNCTRDPRSCMGCATCDAPHTAGCTNCTLCTKCNTQPFCFNCELVDTLLGEIIEIFSFCVQLAIGNDTVIRRRDPNVTLVEVVPLAPDGSSNITGKDIFSQWGIDLLNRWTGVDALATAVAFVQNFNEDVWTAPVGLFFFLRQVPIPFWSRCNRDLHLMCTIGLGLERGLVLALTIALIVGIIGWCLLPQLAGPVNTIVGFIGGWFVVFLYFTIYFSWGYSPLCFSSPQSLLNVLFPAFPSLPMFPVCMAREIDDLQAKWFNRCFWQWAPLTTDNVTCPACDDKLNVVDCEAFGFTGFVSQLQFLIDFYLPDVGAYMRSTCLVRGGCLFARTCADRGPLAFLYDVNFNITHGDANAETLTQCFWLTAPAGLSFIAFVIIAVLFIGFFGSVLLAIVRWVVSIFMMPPFSTLTAGGIADPSQASHGSSSAAAQMIGSSGLQDAYSDRLTDPHRAYYLRRRRRRRQHERPPDWDYDYDDDDDDDHNDDDHNDDDHNSDSEPHDSAGDDDGDGDDRGPMSIPHHLRHRRNPFYNDRQEWVSLAADARAPSLVNLVQDYFRNAVRQIGPPGQRRKKYKQQ